MLNNPITVHFLENPYSWGFLVFWLTMLAVSLALWVVEINQGKVYKGLESSLFWLFSLLMVIFAIFRPIGITRDDVGYLELYKTICPSLTCDHWLQGARDQGWYSLVGFLKSFSQDPRIMLWLAGVSLLVKLALIYSMVRRPMFVLLLYTGVYYQVQDLTSWRVSLALMVFFAAIWLVVRTRNYWNTWAMFACGFFHTQAFVAPLVLVGVVFKRRDCLIICLCLFLVGLILFGVYPDLQIIGSYILEGLKENEIKQRFAKYIEIKMMGSHSGWRPIPIVLYPQILMTLWLLVKVKLDDEKLNSILTGCVIMACLSLWGFAYLPVFQVRFFEFFMVPTVLLLGIRRLTKLELFGVFFVSGVFVTKYNIVHQLIVQP